MEASEQTIENIDRSYSLYHTTHVADVAKHLTESAMRITIYVLLALLSVVARAGELDFIPWGQELWLTPLPQSMTEKPGWTTCGRYFAATPRVSPKRPGTLFFMRMGKEGGADGTFYPRNKVEVVIDEGQYDPTITFIRPAAGDLAPFRVVFKMTSATRAVAASCFE